MKMYSDVDGKYHNVKLIGITVYDKHDTYSTYDLYLEYGDINTGEYVSCKIKPYKTYDGARRYAKKIAEGNGVPLSFASN